MSIQYPLERELVPFKADSDDSGPESKNENENFRVFQWNVLADGLSGSDPALGGFTHATQETLNWEVRSSMIKYDIERYSPDVVCLEELDHFEDDFLPHFSNLGYDGYFVEKVGPGYENIGKNDGVAMFVRKSRVEVLSVQCFSFHGCSQTAIICICLIDNCHPTIIASTHLKATKSEEGEFVRQRQSDELRRRISKIMISSSPLHPSFQDPSSICVIIAGDFNASWRETSFMSFPPLSYQTITNNNEDDSSYFNLESCYNQYYGILFSSVLFFFVNSRNLF